MSNELNVVEALEALARRREERREFLRTSARVGVAAAGLTALAACGDDDDDDDTLTPTPPPAATPTDADILNFALNLEYLEGNFYSLVTTGAGVADSLTTGTGSRGALGTTGARAVPFTDPEVRRLARELAADEIGHITFIRRQLGTSAIAQPAIDLSVSPTSAFSAAARSAGLIGANESFDPYASDENFLLAAFLFSDVGVTAYKGAAPLLQSKAVLEASAGILATEAYHSGSVRTTLYGKGLAAPTLLTNTVRISDARDALDGGTEIDQGVIEGTSGTVANITPADTNAIAFGRTPGQVLNIAYLTRSAATSGGFFPGGVNGTLRSSNANG